MSRSDLGHESAANPQHSDGVQFSLIRINVRGLPNPYLKFETFEAIFTCVFQNS